MPELAYSYRQAPKGLIMGSGEGSPMRNSIVYTVLLRVMMIKCRRLRWAGRVARIKVGRSAFKILTDKLTGNRYLGRPWRRWKDNIRMDLKIYVSTRGIVSILLGTGIIGKPL